MEVSSLKLIILQGPREGETLEFKAGTAIRIGRVIRGNTLPIKDAGISTKHLYIDFESGKWVIRDVDSSNGTLLNNSKLFPFTPFNLHDGDTIKIGEFTSIKVNIEIEIEDRGESQLRRNPRRRAAAKNGGSKKVKGLKKENFSENCDEELENAGPVVENRGRRVGTRRGKGLKDEANEAEIGNAGSMVENRGRRIGTRRGKGLKDEDNAADLEYNGEVEDVVVVKKNQRGRGWLKKVRALENEAAEDLCEVQYLEGKLNASSGAKEPEQQLGSKKVTILKNEAANEAGGDLCEVQDLEGKLNASSGAEEPEQQVGSKNEEKILESSCLDDKEIEIEDKRALGGLRSKRNLGNDAQVEVDEIDGREDEGLERERENVDGLNLGQDVCKGSASGSGVEENFVEVSDEVDLEKMTLGEWFDYLEVHLPKQICDVTEEMIASMRERAERVREFMVQQQNEKGKLPVG